MYPSENSDGPTPGDGNGHLDGSFNDQHLFKNSIIIQAPPKANTEMREEEKHSANTSRSSVIR